MKKIRRRYDREFKISVITELESGETPAQIAREHGVHPGLPSMLKKAKLSYKMPPADLFLQYSKVYHIECIPYGGKELMF